MDRPITHESLDKIVQQRHLLHQSKLFSFPHDENFQIRTTCHQTIGFSVGDHSR
jgi:hypothetical protein